MSTNEEFFFKNLKKTLKFFNNYNNKINCSEIKEADS